jgi:hypothetical protein
MDRELMPAIAALLAAIAEFLPAVLNAAGTALIGWEVWRIGSRAEPQLANAVGNVAQAAGNTAVAGSNLLSGLTSNPAALAVGAGLLLYVVLRR